VGRRKRYKFKKALCGGPPLSFIQQVPPCGPQGEELNGEIEPVRGCQFECGIVFGLRLKTLLNSANRTKISDCPAKEFSWVRNELVKIRVIPSSEI
jgi:hypothetical protein